ncbi:unnamed protein product [Effrenium voratum]|uniref:Uncharacterized protein n=1 Tax=Effrenium voratum TaxID=2562239 RepID=A0AA36IZG9_9DINO|nr:unnamed protein product [Effrenium voratum]CAJ1432909.1 unnamed protein product [Effrenium voratum]
MGAAASGGWFFSETVQVVLVLNDARNVSLLPGEELSALIHLDPNDSGSYVLTRECPANLSVSSTKILAVEFRGIVQGLQDTARCLGEITLPLHHIARQCAGNLVQVWLPLQPSLLAQEEEHIEHFDKALLKAARDPRKPMVCISLYAGSIPQASKDYLFKAPASEKAKRFLGLQQSHSQHARMLQALYREVRSQAHQSALDSSNRSKDGLADSWSRREAFDLPSPEMRNLSEKEASPRVLQETMASLREEIKETTAAANERINKAGENIATLKEMINDKQVELIQRKKEVQRLWHDAESVKLENEKLEVQLARASMRSPTAAEGAEVDGLRKEAQNLATQKEALLLILRDFYGAMGQEPPALSTMVSKHQSRTKKEPEKAAEPSGYAQQEQAWTNMLPRPSELLLSGMLEERCSLSR